MKEKDILNQLNNFKHLRADKNWKDNNRELLFNQISSGQNKTQELSFLDNLKLQLQIVRNISQPAMAAFLICAFILSGGALSLHAARDTAPGDSFYIAKIISEKTQLALTFNEKEKARLGLEFASNRATEIAQVLNDDTQNTDKQEKVRKLVDNFKKEIDLVKTRVSKINSETAPGTNEEEAMVFSANLGREEKGVQISETTEPENELEVKDSEEVAVPEVEVGTTTEAVVEEKKTDPKTILEQAADYFEQEDYDAMLNKLEEADSAITNQGEKEDGQSLDASEETGEVLGVEESTVINEATSTNSVSE